MNLLNRVTFSGFSDEISPVFDEQLRVLQKLGIRYLEMRGVDGKNVDALSPREVKTAGEKLKQAGISVSAIGSPIGKIGIHDDFPAHFEVFRRVVNTAQLLSCRYIRMFSFYKPQGEDPAHYRSEVLDRLHQMKEYARRDKIPWKRMNCCGLIFGISTLKTPKRQTDRWCCPAPEMDS